MNYTDHDRDMAQLLLNCLRDKFRPEDVRAIDAWALSILRSSRTVLPSPKGI